MSRLSRREKRALFGLCALCAVPLGVAGLYAYLDADPSIQLPPRAVPPSPNGFDLYLQAAQLTAQPKPPIDLASDTNGEITVAQAAVRYSRMRREQWHRKAAPGWALFERAQNAQTRVRFDNWYGQDADSVVLRQLARDKQAQINLYLMRGDTDAAIQSSLDIVEMGLDIADGGNLATRLSAAALISQGTALFNDSDRWPEHLTLAQARAAATRLEALMARRPNWDKAIEGERWYQLQEFVTAMDKPDWRQQFESRYCGIGNGGAPEPIRLDKALLRLTAKRTIINNVNAIADRALERQRAPYTPEAPQRSFNYDIVTTWMQDNFYQVRFHQAREKTSLDLLWLRLVLQTYKLERGAYPANLQLLRGERPIPTDEFNGDKPYGYELQGDNYRLWSVGPDGVDDDSRPIDFLTPPTRTRPWHKQLATIHLESKGDWVAGENR